MIRVAGEGAEGERGELAVQVRKSYEEKRRRRKVRGERRPWKLQRMAVDQGELVMKGKAERAEALRAEADLEQFMEVRPSLPFHAILAVGERER